LAGLARLAVINLDFLKGAIMLIQFGLGLLTLVVIELIKEWIKEWIKK
jgi:hypothetical protein